MRTKMNAATETRNSVRHFPGFPIQAEEKKPHWLFRMAVWSGVIMATPESPKGWQLNPATVTLSIVIATLIAGGGYYVGHKDAEYKSLQEQIIDARKKAEAADVKATYAVSGADEKSGHKPEPEKKK